jgi:hypothetical protein
MREAHGHGVKRGLTDDSLAFHDALQVNDRGRPSVSKAFGVSLSCRVAAPGMMKIGRIFGS